MRALLPIGSFLGLVFGWSLVMLCNGTGSATAGTGSTTTSKGGKASPGHARPTPSKKMLVGDFNVANAMTLLYGNYGDYKDYYSEDQQSSTARTGLSSRSKMTKSQVQKLDIGIAGLTKSQLQKLGIGMAGDVPVYTGIVMSVPFVQAGQERYFLITQTVSPRWECHACGVAMGGATFTKVTGGWQLNTESKFVANEGSYGILRKGTLVQIGPDRYGVLFQPEDMHGGDTHVTMDLVAESGNGLKQVLRLMDFGEDNAGNCGEGSDSCYSYRCKAEFVTGANPDYFDVRVTTTGTRPNVHYFVAPANAVQTYVFSKDKYTLRH